MKLPAPLRSLSAFSIALIVSAVAHAVLLTIRFVNPPHDNRTIDARPLEVILVNGETEERPEESKVIAQVALAGGGDAEAGRASSPTPYAALTRMGSDTEEARERQETPREQQNRLLAELRQAIAQLPIPDPRRTDLKPQEIAQEERRLLLIEQLAEMERLVKLENERPKKRFISPATQDSVTALYLDNMRRSIEERGTQSFPTQDGRKLYGQLLMIVLVNHDGSVVSTEIARSSGNLALDRRAEAIVYASAPFGNFSAEMRKSADQIGFTSTFDFKRDATLNTRLQESAQR